MEAAAPAAAGVSAARLQQLSVAGDVMTGFVAYDPSEGEACELSRLLDDSSVPHRYFYQPYASEDAAGEAGAASAPWRQQVRARCARLRGRRAADARTVRTPARRVQPPPTSTYLLRLPPPFTPSRTPAPASHPPRSCCKWTRSGPSRRW